MRPIKVVMSAFGSYAGVETISFEVCDHGIFLITGDTGAGKTTIFDAITYALYDQTSGGRRDGDMMRSQYAKEDTPTYVQLTFSYQNKRYTVTRNPNYQRMSKRKNKDGEYGTTKESASVELIMSDGKPFRGRIKEVNKKIEEIIGLDVNQFTQIVMIAQGDFLKLLHAPSKDRKEIFAKIFDTKIYGKLQEELRDKAKAIYIQLSKNKDSCIREMNEIRCMKESPFVEEWEGLPEFSEVNQDRILELLGLINEEIKQKEKEILGQINAIRKELDERKAFISTAQTINAMFDKLDKSKKEKENLESQKETFEKIKEENLYSKKAQKVWQKEESYLKKEEELSKTQKRIERIKEEIKNLKITLVIKEKEKEKKEVEFLEKSQELTPMITRLKDSMPNYEKLSKKQREETDRNREFQDSQKRCLEIEKTIRLKKEKKEKLSMEQEKRKDSERYYLELCQMVKELEEKKQSLEKMLAAKKRLDRIHKEIETSGRMVETLLNDYTDKSAIYDQTNQDFIKEQVGIIAKRLVKGEPCPVCGSMEHPKKAQLSIKCVTKKEVDEAKKARELADNQLQKAREEHVEIQRRQDKECNYIESEGKRLIGEEFHADQQGLSMIEERAADCNHNIDVKKKELLKAENEKNCYEKNKKEIEALEKELLTLEEKKEEVTQVYQDLKSRYETVVTEIKLMRQNLLYETEQEAKANLQTLQKQGKKLEMEATEATKAYQNQVIAVEKKEAEQRTEETARIRQEKETKDSQKQFESARKEEGFQTVFAYQEARVSERVIEARDREYQEYYETYLKVSEKVKTYSEQTTGKERTQLEELRTKEEQLTQRYQEFTQRSKEIFNIRQGNEKATQTIKVLLNERAKQKEEFEIMNKLDRTANGSLSGSVKLDFQTYMQRRYFEHIIQEANKRLIVMSSNQFILQCRNLQDLGSQGSVGLDLDVYSMVTDKTRDVKTLSGGESFMASLSMALGMADVIQNTAGKIHMDTMFIDEGFGSLDEDTREEAIKILNGLAEGKRLVGIISHVTELKERIHRKLLVRKDENGSRIKWES